MAEFFRSSTLWVIDFQYEGRDRRWFQAFSPHVDVASQVQAMLHELHGDRARLVSLRPATEAEESAYNLGNEPKNVLCPTGRMPRSKGRSE